MSFFRWLAAIFTRLFDPRTYDGVYRIGQSIPRSAVRPRIEQSCVLEHPSVSGYVNSAKAGELPLISAKEILKECHHHRIKPGARCEGLRLMYVTPLMWGSCACNLLSALLKRVYPTHSSPEENPGLKDDAWLWTRCRETFCTVVKQHLPAFMNTVSYQAWLRDYKGHPTLKKKFLSEIDFVGGPASTPYIEAHVKKQIETPHCAFLRDEDKDVDKFPRAILGESSNLLMNLSVYTNPLSKFLKSVFNFESWHEMTHGRFSFTYAMGFSQADLSRWATRVASTLPVTWEQALFINYDHQTFEGTQAESYWFFYLYPVLIWLSTALGLDTKDFLQHILRERAANIRTPWGKFKAFARKGVHMIYDVASPLTRFFRDNVPALADVVLRVITFIRVHLYELYERLILYLGSQHSGSAYTSLGNTVGGHVILLYLYFHWLEVYPERMVDLIFHMIMLGDDATSVAFGRWAKEFVAEYQRLTALSNFKMKCVPVTWINAAFCGRNFVPSNQHVYAVLSPERSFPKLFWCREPGTESYGKAWARVITIAALREWPSVPYFHAGLQRYLRTLPTAQQSSRDHERALRVINAERRGFIRDTEDSFLNLNKDNWSCQPPEFPKIDPASARVFYSERWGSVGAEDLVNRRMEWSNEGVVDDDMLYTVCNAYASGVLM
jgi:hypothetical protein